MGRLEHVKLSSQALFSNPEMDGVHCKYFFVDHLCPDKSGAWVEETYGEKASVIYINKMHVKRKDGKAIFNKCVALNTGALCALDEGFDYLVFVDADTIVRKDFCKYLGKNASPDAFMFVQSIEAKRDLNGMLVVNTTDFTLSGGFDVHMAGWGAEDLELRLKLFLKLGRPFMEISPSIASSIHHEDNARTTNYEEQDKEKSHILNLNRLCHSVFEWTGGIHLLDMYFHQRNSPNTAFQQFISPQHAKFCHPHIGYCVQRLLGIDGTLHPSSVL